MPNGDACTMFSPSSLRVGASGNLGSRFSPQVLSTRSLPDSTNGANPVESAAAMTCPPTMACARSALPL